MNPRKPYFTDLSDAEWERLKGLLPQKRTPPERAREYIKGGLYILRTGCSWRLLPHDFSPWSTVHTYFRKLLPEDLSDFIACYNADNRFQRQPTWSPERSDGRWRMFTYERTAGPG